MAAIIEIAVSPEHIDNEDLISQKLLKKLPINSNPLDYVLKRRSIDARSKNVLFRLQFEKKLDDNEQQQSGIQFPAYIGKRKKVIVVGSGPAGYFAALSLLANGFRPIVLDRGKDVRSRRRDLRAIQQFGVVNPHSNYCFGEGGAGTYSDGKLYTRSHKRGKIIDILKILVDHGASSDILIDAHPHIGSNKLPAIIAEIRNTIESNGGEVHFNSFVTDLIIQGDQLMGLSTESGKEYFAEAIILATGHSARDIFKLLDSKNILLEAKDFALGVRVEHPQALIDQIQYRQKPRHKNLPAASYNVVCQINGEGVFSFCNCPGGLIVPAATAPGEIVVNGMSLSKRDSPFSNSGFVTSLKISELNKKGYQGVFAGLEFQKKIEQDLFKAGDGSQKAPAQLLTDFVNKNLSKNLRSSSYIPGVYSSPLHELLPSFIYERLSKGMLEINKKMKGFYTSEAQLVATESRTSSPIRIPRDDKTRMHPQLKGLFPCGEGAGYAGGILSAAMDGQNVANSVSVFLGV